MNRSTNCLDGSPGFPIRCTKREDGKFEAFSEAHPQHKFEGVDEIDAIRTATSELRDKLLRGEL